VLPTESVEVAGPSLASRANAPAGENSLSAKLSAPTKVWPAVDLSNAR
jgi:hypothetical protein